MTKYLVIVLLATLLVVAVIAMGPRGASVAAASTAGEVDPSPAPTDPCILNCTLPQCPPCSGEPANWAN
jgi:hypothetical protein